MSNILQPTKAESAATPTPGPAPSTKAETEFEISSTLKPPGADTSSDTSSTKSAPGQQETAASNLNPNQMMDLDLSFFEKSASSSSVKSSSSAGKNASAKPNLPSDPKSGKPESNSIYLNKLLQDIFHQPQASSASASSSSSPVPSSNTNIGGGGVLKPSPASAVSNKKQEPDKNCKYSG